MSIFNNGTGKFLAGAFDRGITSIKDFFDIDQNAEREATQKLDRIQDDEDSVYDKASANEEEEEKEKEEEVEKEEEHTSFFSNLFSGFFGGTSSDDSERDSREASSSFWDRDPGQDRQDENDRQERENSEREDYERRSRNDDER